MTKSAVATFVLLFVLLVPAVGQKNVVPVAPQHEVSCPVGEVRADITTSLPKPWWSTPQQGKLQAAAIQVIAGKKTLVCRYSAYGTQVSVMRAFPDGARDCKAVGNHFVCN